MGLLLHFLAWRYRLPPRQARKVRTNRRLLVPMRDGVTLLADRWFGSDNERAPVILMRCPYGRGSIFGVMAALLAERGFQVVLQSCRGTAGSGGKFDPMRQEQADGSDTVDWVRTQPWFSGRLYTYGPSYLGFTQWALAREAGEKISAMALNVTQSNFKNETLAFGGFTQEGSLAWTRIILGQINPPAVWQRLTGLAKGSNNAKIHRHLPLGELDVRALGQEVSWWRDWLLHADPKDAWWSVADHSGDVPHVTVPAVMVSGWRDIFLPWQVKDFEAMQAKGRTVWLTIGPWAHASFAGMAEAMRQALKLFTANGANVQPFPGDGRVRLYVAGAKEWRNYPSWPPPGAAENRLYLHPKAGLAAVPAPPNDSPTSYVYDPANPTPAIEGPRLFGVSKLPDMSTLDRRADTVSFKTSKLAKDFEVIGPVRVELFIRSSIEHTDFYVCLCEIDERERPLHVVDGYIRLRPDDPPPDSQGIRHVSITCWPTAYRFSKGNRLQLIVASGAHPRYARNLGAGEPPLTATRMAIATQQIFQDDVYQSALYLTTLDTLDSFSTLEETRFVS